MSLFSIFQRKPQIEKLLELAIKKGATNVECTQDSDGGVSFTMTPTTGSQPNHPHTQKQSKQHHQNPPRPKPGERGYGGRPN